MPSLSAIRRRWWLLLGGLLGIAAATLPPAVGGCIYHDTCIMVTTPGHDWCRNVALAKQWPIGGSFDDAVPILRPDGAVPRGCRCYNDAEDEIFDLEVPECRLEQFVDDLEQAARQECEALVMPGYDHNCSITSGKQASIVEGTFYDGVGACIGNCEYGQPPANGSCPDPNPYECATGGGDPSCDPDGDNETSTGDSGLDETGSDTSGGMMLDPLDHLDMSAFVTCDERDCEIDEAFARRLYSDPSPLLAQSTRLVHQPKTQRHVLYGVEPGSLAYALGLRDGDQLESIDGMIIHDLDSALQAYARLGDAAALDVRVKRGSQWLDFTYSFVR